MLDIKKFVYNFKNYIEKVQRKNAKTFEKINLNKINEALQHYQEILEKGYKNNKFMKNDNKLQLEKGTLIHGMGFDEDVLKSISENGLVGPAFTGSIASDYTPYSVCFHVIPQNQSMSDYFEFYNTRFKGEDLGRLQNEEGAATNYRLEYAYLPHKNKNHNAKQIAFIVNRTEDIDMLLQDDEWKKTNSDLISPGFVNRYGKIPERVATILFGIPVNSLSGILIPPAMEKDVDKIQILKKLFPDKYITTSEGVLIYEPQIEKKEENKNDNIHVDEEIRKKVLSHKNKLGIGNMQRNIRLGNSGEMHRYTASDGSKYLVKPAYKKHTKKVEQFRAFIQRAAYDVQRIIDPQSAVACNVKRLDIDGNEAPGTIQEEIDGVNFDDIPGSTSEKLQRYAPQFLRELVTDYLLGNYDSHSGNFIVDKNGILRGIDKEQSMKFITDDRTKSIDTNFAPNGVFHEPVYNKLFRMYENGKIDIDLREITSYLDKIDNIPDEQYRKIFENYAHTRANNTQEKNILLDLIVQRKKDARKNIEEFLINAKANRVAKYKGITSEEVKKKVGILDKKNSITSTQDLGRETIYEQSDTLGKNEVKQEIMNHVKTLENEHDSNEGKNSIN